MLGMTYTLKARKRIFKIKNEENLTYMETSKRFKVGIATLFRWSKKIEPEVTRNKPATKIDMKALKLDVKKNPDAYQWERAKKFKVHTSAICRALKRLNISYKKNSVSPTGKNSKSSSVSNSDKNI